MRLEMDICSTLVENTMDYKYHKDYNRAEEMLRMSVKQETSLTFSILVIALASLFASSPILGNQQALAQGEGGGGGGAAGGGQKIEEYSARCPGALHLVAI